MRRDSTFLNWQTIWAAGLAAITLFLSLYNLERFPSPWFDEGIHLLVAKRLALVGEYRFGPAVGPTVFFPVAAAFRLLGIRLLSARLAMAGYLLLCVAVFYALVRRISGWKVATVGTLLLLSSPGVNLLYWGRQVLGEVPAAMFFLLGTLTWWGALQEERRSQKRYKLILSGLLFGLAVLTKNQFLLLLPAWLVLWIADRLYYRQAGASGFALPLLTVIFCATAWYAGQTLLFPNGQGLATQDVQEWSSALRRGVFVLSTARMGDALKFLTGKDVFYAWSLPGCLYAALRSARRSREGLQWAMLTAVAGVWLLWFVFLSVGWPRYAFPPLMLSAFFIAQAFHDLTDGYRISAGRILEGIRTGQSDAPLLGRAALITLLVLILLRPLQARFTEIVSSNDDAPWQIAAYIQEHLPEDMEIETYEPEVCFLSGHSCHLPPGWVMNASIAYAWYGAPPPSDYYDFRERGAPYLLIGDFGRWVHLYDPETVARDYELEASFGGYELYRLREGR